ncbi:MAG TPA: response regulator transcription factor [Tepidisphaeraceae bacterium]|nr:response regulator transcription factor [Tepidisphaeraceae bacterium]
MTIRVLLADDTKTMRDGLRALLESDAGVAVVGEAASGTEAVRLTRELAPDVVVMDIRMPDMDGVQATRQLKAVGASARVVAITAALDETLAERLREAGAVGIVPKEEVFEKLLPAVREAAAANIRDSLGGAPAQKRRAKR